MNDLTGMMREHGSERPGFHRARSAVAVGLSIATLGYMAKAVLDETRQSVFRPVSSVEPASVEPVCSSGRLLFEKQIPNGNASLQIHEKLDSVTENPKGYVCVRLLSDQSARELPRYMSLSIDSVMREDRTDASESYSQYAGWLAVGLGEEVTIKGVVDPTDTVTYSGRPEVEVTALYTAQFNKQGSISETRLAIDGVAQNSPQ